MNKEKENELFLRCAENYDTKSMTGFADFVKKFDGDNDEKKYLARVKSLVEIRNYFARFRVYGLKEYNSLENLLEETKYFAYPQTIVKTTSDNGWYFEDIAALRVKLEEYLFKIYRQEL